MKITVYIISHNYGNFLTDAVESVLRQTINDWELLIIDDNSSDNTQEVMNLYRGHERIRLFTTEGIGLPAVCNLALREAKGECIIRLDGDDIFDENILLVLGNWLDRHPEEVMVFPDYFFIDEDGEVYAHERRESIYDKNHIFDMPANGACCLIRKKVLNEIGGYREDLGAMDGFDLWNKLLRRYKPSNINLPLFYYRRHAGNLTDKTHHILNARRSIKFDAISDKLNDYRPIVAVIPCRKNFDFSPDVWRREIQGQSLLQWKIEKCIRSTLFDHIVIASDNPHVKDIMSCFDDLRLSFFQRERQDTIRSKSIVPMLEEIVTPLDSELNGLTVLSYLQAPFVTSATLEEAISTLILNEADCSFGVEELRTQLFKRDSHGLQSLNPPKGLTTDFDIIYRETNASLATRNRNFKKGALDGPSVVHFVVSQDECFFVDSEQKLKIANILAEN